VLDPGDDVLLVSPYWPYSGDDQGCHARALLVPHATARQCGPYATLGISPSAPRSIYYNTRKSHGAQFFSRAEADEVAAFRQKQT